MRQTTEKVDGLSKLLEIKMKDVEIEKEKTGKLIDIVTKESGEAEKEAEAAAVKAAETEEIANAAKKKKAEADAELAEAIPAMEAATKAVDCLTKDSIQELKNLGSPPAACVEVAKAGLILLKNEKKNHAWPNAQKMMNNPNQFIEMVKSFDGNNIDEWKLKAVEPLLALDFFNFETMKGKSTAAAYLCAYVVNIVKYNSIYKKVKPLKDMADEAEAFAQSKLAELQVVKDKVAAINAEVQKLKDQLFDAQAKKQAVEDEAKALMD
jgi:dynein heavy chain